MLFLQSSIYPDVVHWCEEITILLEKEISVGTLTTIYIIDVLAVVEIGWLY